MTVKKSLGFRCFKIGQLKQRTLMSLPGSNGRLLGPPNLFHYHTKSGFMAPRGYFHVCIHMQGCMFSCSVSYRKGETEVNSVHPCFARLLSVSSCPSKCVAVLMEVRGPRTCVKNQCEAIMISRTDPKRKKKDPKLLVPT